MTTLTGSIERLANTAFVVPSARRNQDYLVVDLLADAKSNRELMGRRLARERGKSWPIPPDVQRGRSRHTEGFTWWAVNYEPLIDGRYAFVATADVKRWLAAGVRETTDGRPWRKNVTIQVGR